MDKKITSIKDIDDNAEGRLLLIALILLKVDGYTKYTPGEIIKILNDKADLIEDKSKAK